jgi:hypothetical protein
MIEIDLKPGGQSSGQTSLGWVEASSSVELHNMNFNRVRLRINGVIYTEKSKECIEAFKKAKLWATLKD